jgi:hypothetical protein
MDRICSAYLYLLSSYHLVTGIVSVCFPGFAMSFYKALYAYDPVERQHIWLVLKPWGALAIFAGVAGFYAARDPQRYVGVVIGLTGLLVLRAVLRLVYEKDAGAMLRIPPRRNRVNVALILAGVLILGSWLAWRPA